MNTNQPLTPWSRETCVAYVRAQNEAGMRPNSAKLYPAEVEEIRELLADGEMTQVDIAERYHVSKMAISDINCGKSWKQVAA